MGQRAHAGHFAEPESCAAESRVGVSLRRAGDELSLSRACGSVGVARTMKTSSTLLIVGIVVLVLYLWYQTKKPAATTTAKTATTPASTTADPLTAALNALTKALKGGSSGGGGGKSAAPEGSSAASSGKATAAGQNVSQTSPDSITSPDGSIVQNPDGSITDKNSGLTYNMDGTVQGSANTIPVGMDASGNTVYQSSDGNLVDSEGSIVDAGSVTPYDTGAGITPGPEQDMSAVDTTGADLTGDGGESDWG